MVGLAIINICFAMLVLAISYDQAMHNALDFYRSTLVVILQAAGTAAIAAAALALRRARFILLVISAISLITMPVSCGISASGYPGGDDGGGLGWFFRVGPCSLVAMLVGWFTLIFGIILRGRKQVKERCRRAWEIAHKMQ